MANQKCAPGREPRGAGDVVGDAANNPDTLPPAAQKVNGQADAATTDGGGPPDAPPLDWDSLERSFGDVTPDPDALIAQADLFAWDHGEDFVVTLMSPKAGRTPTKAFRPGQRDELKRWVEGTKDNVYFTVNKLRDGYDKNKKPPKDDILGLRFLHVDIDPRHDKDLAAERRRIHDLITDAERLGALGVPRPTAIICSGGGFQAFWRLAKPAKIRAGAAREAHVEELEGYNRRLAELLGGDLSCHNIDRLMRCAGTINWPDEPKKKRGRVPIVARLVAHRRDLTFTSKDFVHLLDANPPAKANGEDRSPAAAKVRVKIRWDDLPAGDVDSLRVSDRIKDVIRLGKAADPERYPSESEPLWAALLAMVAGGHDDDRIAAVVSDEANGVSAHCRSKEDNPRGCIKRQIKKARQKAAADEIMKINRDYFAALEGGKLRFFREEPDHTLASMDKQAFTFELGDRFVLLDDGEGEKKKVSAVKLWLISERRRYYKRGFILDPSGNFDEHTYNLWKGFGVEPAPGDWSPMELHIRDTLAAADDVAAEYILDWTAWTFQNPATPPRVAIAFRGEEGVGKGVFASNIVRAFGVHGMRIQSMRHLTGTFNAHLRHLCVLFCDEAVVAADTDGIGVLKGLITEAKTPIEKKGIDVVTADNHLHIILASNSRWIVPAGIEARRFAVFEVSQARRGDKAYFDKLWDQMKHGGGLEAMVHDLLKRDIDGFSPEGDRPDTVALNEQKAMTQRGFEKTWVDLLRHGEVPATRFGFAGTDKPRVATTELTEFARKRQLRDDISYNDVAQLFAKLGYEKDDKKRPRGWVVPPLPEARTGWDRAMFPVTWDDTESWALMEDDRRY